MRRCTVSIMGADSQQHSLETDGASLFDAAYKALQQRSQINAGGVQTVGSVQKF